jgi:hypothetical protein
LLQVSLDTSQSLHGYNLLNRITPRKEHRCRLLENKVFRRTFAPETKDAAGGGQTFVMRSSTVCIVHVIDVIRVMKSRSMKLASKR